MGASASVIALPVTLPIMALGFGLTLIKERYEEPEMLLANVKKITKVVETNKVARVFAGIFTLGLTELMSHKKVAVEYIYEDEYIGSDKIKVDENAAACFEAASDFATVNQKCKESFKIKRQNIQQQAVRLAREEAASIYQKAEELSSVELKLEKYEIALSKCEEACMSGATEVVFNTLNKIFESCLRYDAHDEARNVIQVVRKYFPSEADRLQEALVKKQIESWSPDYESRVLKEQEQEQNETIVFAVA